MIFYVVYVWNSIALVHSVQLLKGLKQNFTVTLILSRTDAHLHLHVFQADKEQLGEYSPVLQNHLKLSLIIYIPVKIVSF